MTSRSRVNKFIICLILITFTTGCTVMKSLPATDAQAIAGQIKGGDRIKITQNDLTDVTFKVSAITDEGISGNGVFVAYSDIRNIQVRHFSTAKTVGLVAIIIVGGILILVANSDELGPGIASVP